MTYTMHDALEVANLAATDIVRLGCASNQKLLALLMLRIIQITSAEILTSFERRRVV
ncbi:hypothetical protein [Nostoc sp.]|uniref:hypothetical protein n=1 Tax=Nostoc sp. TaxID=1180 RepID=UPI002FF94C82